MPITKCPACGERVRVRDGDRRVRCPECGKSFRTDTDDDDEGERPRRPRRAAPARRGRRSKGPLLVGAGVLLAVVVVAVMLIARKGGDGATAPADPAKVTLENFRRVQVGMDLAEVEGILGGSESSSENDMRRAYAKALGEVHAAMETGWSRFSGAATWRRWEGKNLRVWVVFAKAREDGPPLAAFSTALDESGGKATPHSGIQSFLGNTDLAEANARRKQEQALRDDPKWVRGPQARELILGDWREPSVSGYLFHRDGKLTTFKQYETHIYGSETTFRVLDDTHVEIVPPRMHPDLPTIPQKYEFRINPDELVLFETGTNPIIPIRGPYYRVPAPPGKPGYDKVIGPMLATIRGADRDRAFTMFREYKRLGKSGAPGLPVMLELALGADDRAAREAMDAIGWMREAGAPAVPTLIQVARGADAKKATSAVYGLAHIGPAARDALPALRPLLTTATDGSLRTALTYAIERIEGKKKP
jgi:hypothetical protein